MAINLVDIAIVLIEMVSLAYFYRKLFGVCRKNRSVPLKCLAYGLAGGAVLSLGFLRSPLIQSFAAGIVAYVVVEVLYEGNYKDKLFGAMLFSVIQLGAEAITWIASTLLLGMILIPYTNIPPDTYWPGAFISKGIGFLIIICIPYIKLNAYKKIESKFMPVYCLLPITTIIIIYQFVEIAYHSHSLEIYLRVASVCLLHVLTNIALIYLLKQQTKLDTLNAELLLKQIQQDAQLTAYQAMAKRIDIHNRIKHESKRTLDILYKLLCNEKFAEAKTYLQNTSSDLDKYQPVLAKDAVLNAILGIAYEQAEKAGCILTLDILLNSPILILPQHLVVVLGNCLENAVEASALAVDQEKVITLEMRTSTMDLFIRITNPVAHKIEISANKLLETSKDDKEKHGFGLKNVQDIVALYHGDLQLASTEKTFTTNIRMNNVDLQNLR